MRGEARGTKETATDTLRKLELEAAGILRPLITPYGLPPDAKIELRLTPAPRVEVIPAMTLWNIALIAPWEDR